MIFKNSGSREPRNVFSLFPPKFKLQFPFLKPKDGSVANKGPMEVAVAGGGSEKIESQKPGFVRFPKAQVAVPPLVVAENDETGKTSNPIIFWQKIGKIQKLGLIHQELAFHHGNQ
ncbi:hypothetical protein TIFTF001_048440 [Ficus carica]|uniref:Uncharacterized protein n=1 Tax=Ficus carica TaxID=3494 RepID=A0AA87ZL53_FICCA|nr:hypothetical protein TIFTF001_048440 [Ficus carica]